MQFQQYMCLPDPTPLYVTMGAVAGNMLTGHPVWLMIIGPSGCGKTFMLESLMLIPRTIRVASIKGESALLSGVKKKDRIKDATGGLLREVADHGCLVFMDFASVLEKSYETVKDLFSAFREIYGGEWSRSIGGEGGQTLHWQGKAAIIGGVTPAIDRQPEQGRALGERFLYYRYPLTEGYQESMCAANVTHPTDDIVQMRLAVDGMFAGLGLEFGKERERKELGLADRDRIVGIAQLGSRARSVIPRDSYSKEVIDVPAVEVGTRMSQELTQLWLGMKEIGVSEAEAWTAVERVAMDSMPLGRKLVLEAIEGGVGAAVAIARKVRVSESAAKRAVEDLHLLGLVKRGSQGQEWVVSEWVKDRVGKETGRGEDMCGNG